MLLKKQTVWLLTMLSLVVVLSVYYLTSPEQNNQEFMAYENENQALDANANNETDTDVTLEQMDDGTIISSISSDELFTALRLEIEDQRSRLRDQLQSIVASGEVSAQEKSQAMDRIQELSELTAKEAVLETLIKSKGYDDALVRADGSQVRVTIKAQEHSKDAAVDIIQLVKSEIGSMQTVAVEFQPVK